MPPYPLTLQGHEMVVAARRAVVAQMLARPPKLFKPRKHDKVVSSGNKWCARCTFAVPRSL